MESSPATLLGNQIAKLEEEQQSMKRELALFREELVATGLLRGAPDSENHPEELGDTEVLRGARVHESHPEEHGDIGALDSHRRELGARDIHPDSHRRELGATGVLGGTLDSHNPQHNPVATGVLRGALDPDSQAFKEQVEARLLALEARWNEFPGLQHQVERLDIMENFYRVCQARFQELDRVSVLVTQLRVGVDHVKNAVPVLGGYLSELQEAVGDPDRLTRLEQQVEELRAGLFQRAGNAAGPSQPTDPNQAAKARLQAPPAQGGDPANAIPKKPTRPVPHPPP